MAIASAFLPLPSLQAYGPWFPLSELPKAVIWQSWSGSGCEVVYLEASVVVHGILAAAALSCVHWMMLIPAAPSVEHCMLTSWPFRKTLFRGVLVSSDKAPANYISCKLICKVKIKYSHTRHRALGPELIPVYRQSTRRRLFKSSMHHR